MKNANEVIKALLKDINLFRLSGDAQTPLKEALAAQLDDTIARAEEYMNRPKQKPTETPAESAQ